jgi:energy-coupling factor transporter ATP-binding protein EcfA2
MLIRKYNPWHISNTGEKETDKLLSLVNDTDETFCVIHGLRISSRFHKTKQAGECDFLIMNRLGIMVIEVKGGIMAYGMRADGDTGFYRIVGDNEKEYVKDPFIQVDGNADAITKYIKEKEIKNVFIGSMVCFPECEFGGEGISEGDLWHRGHPQSLHCMIIDSMEQQQEDFRRNQRAMGHTKYIEWKELEKDEMMKISKVLEPEFDPRMYRKSLMINVEETERRREEGLNILIGLEENRRLVVQGPPGSGKSTFALHMIDSLCRKDEKRGIYICWNELLICEVDQRLNRLIPDLPEDQLHKMVFYDLICGWAEKVGEPGLMPTYEDINKGLLRQKVKGIIKKLGAKGMVQKYDFAIIDEAQDIFDKGIDLLLQALLKDNNPLQKGNYCIFFDDSQNYPDELNESDLYVWSRDAFKSYGACYTLSDNLRAGAGNGIRELILDTLAGRLDAENGYGEDVIFRTWREPDLLKKEILNVVLKERFMGQVGMEDIQNYMIN